MARVLVMYKTPKDAQAFDKYYFETHVPIAKKLPGLRKYEVSRGLCRLPETRDFIGLRCCTSTTWRRFRRRLRAQRDRPRRRMCRCLRRSRVRCRF